MLYILKRLIFILFIMAILVFSYQKIFDPFSSPTPLKISDPPIKMRILLVPLDSRPPCRKFVEDVAKIAGIEIISPPSELLDYYTVKGNGEKLCAWVENHIVDADGVILSIDQLLHGGLIASRENPASKIAEKTLLDFLERLRAKKKYIPIYVFNIMPRLAPPNSLKDYRIRQSLMEWSRLEDYYSLAGRGDILERITTLEKSIPLDIRTNYLQTYVDNTKLNLALMRLLKEGYISKLVIGQDDSEPYGIPNIEKRKVLKVIDNDPFLKNNVILTHGADEIALTSLATLYGELWRHNLPVYVEYNDENIRQKIMPYMAISVEEVVDEKLNLLNAKKSTFKDAKMILFVACTNEENLHLRKKAAEKIRTYIEKGYYVALVDLSEHFNKTETIFPLLLETETPVQGLIAYAGWNTTGNAVGTALSEAYIFSIARKHAQSKDDVLSLYAANLKFLNDRYLEDYYYLKKNIDLIKEKLAKMTDKNAGDLDTMRDYQLANELLQTIMQEDLDKLKTATAFKLPITIPTPRGRGAISVQDIGVDARYPWPRTFEIYLSTTLWLQEHTVN